MQFVNRNILIGNFSVIFFLLTIFSAAAQQNSDEETFRKALNFADSVYALQDYESAKAAYQYAARLQNTAHIQQQLATIDSKIAETEALNKKYNLAVSEVRQALNASDLPKAKERLEYALTLKPSEVWAIEKLAEVNKTLSDQAELLRQFDELIANGDRFFTSEKYADAKTEYEAALKLMPNSAVAKEKIAAVKTKVQDIDSEYKRQITAGDALYRQNELEEAKTAYQAAVQLKPDQPYPKQKIEQIDNIIHGEAALAAELEVVVRAADQAFDNQNYTLATKKYNEALDILSSHEHSKERLQEIRRLIGENESKQLAYNGFIDKANAHFDNKRYPEAKNEYQNALDVLPDEAFPKERIAQINKIGDLAQLESAYKAAIAEGDALFKSKSWSESIVKYQEALALKPEESYPQQQIDKANAELGTIAEVNSSYIAAIEVADALFSQEKWTDAIAAYQSASKIKPAETYPKQQIEKADLNKRYGESLAIADELFNAQKWNESIPAYQAALKIKPDETYPTDQIAIAKAKIGDLAQLESNYKTAIAEGDALFKSKSWSESIVKYQEALALKPEESYPQQQIDKANAELGAIAEVNSSYTAAIEAADALFSQEKWTDAITAYQSASKIKPTETYPKQQIEKADLNKRYGESITIADELFNAQKWNESIPAYQATLKIKPDETYPTDQIAIAKAKIGDLAQLENNYKAAITEGDALFKSKSWSESIVKYQEALALKPEESYPQQQIDKANAELGTIAEVNSSYTAAIEAADALFSQEKWTDAIAAYQSASKIKPSEAYPKQQIEKADLNKRYGESLAVADDLFNAQKWNESIPAYQAALKIKPDDTYPTDQIAIAKAKIGDLAQLESNYKAAITEGDALFKSKSWSESIVKYQEALVLKPEESYPQQQIDKANAELGIIAEINSSYTAAIEAADALFSQEKWTDAITAYQSASKIKPAETYPKQQIELANAEIKALADRDVAYNNGIATADNLFRSSKWEEAKTAYEAALSIKESESYPQAQIELCNEQLRIAQEKLAAEQALEANYQSALTQADNAFKASQWEESVSLYRQALELKPNENYPQQQIALATQELEKIAATQKSYNDLIAKGDDLFQKEEWQSAKTTFQQAATILPEETYPVQKITAIDKILADIALDAEKAAENARIYREKVTEANVFINEKNYQAAINTLNSALNYKPNDDYAVKKIAELQKIIDDAAFAKSEYARLIAEGDAAFAIEKYRDAITAYRAAMRQQPDEMYPRKKISDAERNMEYTPEKRRQLAQESLQRGEDAVKTSTYDAAMRAFGNAYYWYPEEGESTRNKIKSIVATLEAGTEKTLLEEPMSLTSNRRGTIELDIKPTEIKGTAYILFKISGNYENNVNVFLRWGRSGNEYGTTVVTLVYGLDDIYYCAEIKGATNGLTWIAFIPENTDVTIEEAKLMSR
ncbi:MAG: tetratricopeptide repeat protein [Bacteroidales bacterium]|nr:tetratricopeptide repeat protein [Bacteroidales bacterium]